MTNLFLQITCMKRTDLKILLLQFDLEKILYNHLKKALNHLLLAMNFVNYSSILTQPVDKMTCAISKGSNEKI